MDLPENVRYNENPAIVEKLLDSLKKKGGYCPCRIQKIPDNLCPCREFREQIADPAFSGYCHCRLYYKEPKKEN